MDWKELTKPSIGKLILTILISITLVPFIEYDTGIRCVTTPCASSAEGSIASWLLFSHDFDVYSVSYANLIIGLILSYIASCLLIFLLIRIKK